MLAITNLFEESVKNHPNNVFLWEKKNTQFEPLSFLETRSIVYKFSAGLIDLGLEKGDRVILFSEGRNEWVVSELGVLYAGAVNVPISVKLSEPEDLFFRIEHSGAKMIISSKSQLKKLQVLKPRLKKIKKIIILGENEPADPDTILFKEVVNAGEKFLNEKPEIFAKRWQDVKPNDYATICYTSGTTADPKGIILTHRNYTSNVEHSLDLVDVPEKYITLLILPWDHSFAHTTGIYAMMKTGSSLASVQPGKTALETLKNIPVNIKEIKPDFLLSVPALAKNIRKNIETGVSSKGKIAETLFKFGLKVGYAYNGYGWNKGKGWRFVLKPVYSLIDSILFKKVRESFGGRLKFFVGGGALLDIELQKFFYAIGIPMMQGYGLTEASPVISANSLKKHKLGSSGSVASAIELKICDEDGNSLATGIKGEIVIRGENVMAGYWNNEEATKQTIKNGWLHTGDMGYLDEDGFLYVLGRFKSLLIADDGEKYSPESIEEAIIGNSPFIEQCMLYNNQNPYTVALIVVNAEALKKWLIEKHFITDKEKAVTEALKHVASEINEYRTGKKYASLFPQRWLPVSVAIIEEQFSEDNGLLNSTLKLVRGKVVEKYQDRIKYLYTPDAKDICNDKNKVAINNALKLDK